MKIDQIKMGSLLSYLSLILGTVVSLVYTPIMIERLGQSEYGVYSIVLPMVSYLNLFSFGLGSAYTRFYTRYKEANDKYKCNNDDMALGVYDYYKQHNLKLPLILGINNSPEMNQKIQAGEIYGTVDNGTNDQISYICKLLNDILNKNTAKYHKIWYSKPFAIEK